MNPVTILELASHRLGRRAENGADYEEAGLPIIGGCVGCGATVAAYNAYPSQSGYLACADCIGEGGWSDVETANREIFDDDLPLPAGGYCCQCGEAGHTDEDPH